MTREYYGTKKVTAWEDTKDGNLGYGVKYADGYVSFSPKDVFEAAYQPLDALSFGHAVEAAKTGSKIRRAGWNGPGQFVVYMPELNLPPYSTQGTDRKVNDRTAKWIGEDTPLESQPYFALFNAQKKWQPGWVPSVSDVLANDWQVIE